MRSMKVGRAIERGTTAGALLAAMAWISCAVTVGGCGDDGAPVPAPGGAAGTNSGDAGPPAPPPPPPPPPAPGSVKVGPASGTKTSEAGGKVTIPVVLGKKPTGRVEIPVASSKPTEGTVDVATLVFTESDWDTPKTITVTGANDDAADGPQPYTVELGKVQSSDGTFAGLDPADVALTNDDDDAPSVVVGAPSPDGSTTEAGGKVTFTVKLGSKPSAAVTIPVSSDKETEGKADKASLVFDATNWSAPQTVTVTGQNDQVADGDQTYKIALGAADSTDPGYKGLDAPDVTLKNVDDDTPAVSVGTPTPTTTSEAGGTSKFTLRLGSKPTANVTIPLSSENVAEATVSPASVTFTPDDYDQPKEVTVTGVNDDVDDGDQAVKILVGKATSDDARYKDIDGADVSLTNTDDDTAGIAVGQPQPGAQTKEDGTAATFTVRLQTKPTANVTIPLSSSNEAEGKVDAASLVFTAANWDTPQTVTVTGQNDFVQDGAIAYKALLGAATSADAKYAGIDAADVDLTNVDDDTASVTATPDGATTSESGDRVRISVTLGSEPKADVKLPVTVSKPGEAEVDVAELTFTAANWNTPQIVTVSSKQDQVDDGDVPYDVTIGAPVTTDATYGALAAKTVPLTSVDDDAAGVMVVAATDPLHTTEGAGTATFTVRLATKPTGTVTIPITSKNTDEGTVSAASLSFDETSWNTAQTVTVTGVGDAILDGAVAYLVEVGAPTGADTAYTALGAQNVAVENADDEVAGLVVEKTAGTNTSEDETKVTFGVKLAVKPTKDVTVAVASSNTSEGTVDKATLTFTPANWDTAQEVVVTGVADGTHDGNVGYDVTFTADAGYGGATVVQKLENLDIDPAPAPADPADPLNPVDPADPGAGG